MTDSPKAAARRLWIGWSLAAVVLIAAAAWAGWYYFILDDNPVPGVEKMLDESGPPAGATREEAEAWLNKWGIRNHRERSLLDSGGFPATAGPLDFAVLVPGVSGDYVVGIMEAPHRSGWARWIYLYFFFDDHGRLIQYVVKAWDGYF